MKIAVSMWPLSNQSIPSDGNEREKDMKFAIRVLCFLEKTVSAKCRDIPGPLKVLL